MMRVRTLKQDVGDECQDAEVGRRLRGHPDLASSCRARCSTMCEWQGRKGLTQWWRAVNRPRVDTTPVAAGV